MVSLLNYVQFVCLDMLHLEDIIKNQLPLVAISSGIYACILNGGAHLLGHIVVLTLILVSWRV